MKFIVLLATLLLSNLSFGDCLDRFELGAPSLNVKGITTLCRRDFVTFYHQDCKIPYLTYEKLTSEMIGGSESRKSFHSDPDLPKESRATMKDYDNRSKIQIDIGHMAPAADFRQNSISQYESFHLSNGVPQNSNLNRGLWKLLENKVREQVKKNGILEVYTGVVLPFKPEMIGSVCKPVAFYKIIVDPKTLKTISFIVPNVAQESTLVDKQTSISQIEYITEIEFLTKINRYEIKPDQQMFE